jgi:hypothetical protein
VTGSRTVPQVFVGGKHIGGCDGEKKMGGLLGALSRESRHVCVCVCVCVCRARTRVVATTPPPLTHKTESQTTTKHTHLGARADTMAAFQAGKLKTLLADAGITV